MARSIRTFVRERLGLARVGDAVEALTRRMDQHELQLAELRAFATVAQGTSFVEASAPRSSVLVSVVLPTRDRAERLTSAIESVHRSSHPHWELVVVDDGSSDRTSEVIAAQRDPRVRSVATGGVGAAAARNLGLAAATGEWVTFLDDDNLLGPHWLKAVAEAALDEPAVSVRYGGQLRQPEPAEDTRDLARMVFVEPFDPARLLRGNYIDLGALAVRRDCDQLWFDESLRRFIDWELIVRLASQYEVRPLAVQSGVYIARHDGRISRDVEGDWREMARRLADPADPLGTPRPRR